MQPEPERLVLAGQLADHPLQPRPIRRERDARRAAAETDHRHAVGWLQTIDEALNRLADSERAAKTDVLLIHRDHDQSAARRFLVRRVAGRYGRRRTLLCLER